MSDNRGKPARAGHDVSNEPRIPAGNGRESGEWTDEAGLSRGAKAILRQNCPKGYTVVSMNVTAYTSGPESTGKRPGDPQYGITKSGAIAGPGTLAAPPGLMGHRMYVPGYGWGTVQDIGGAIKGNHLDVWFEKVEDARKWGRQNLDVVVCKK